MTPKQCIYIKSVIVFDKSRFSFTKLLMKFYALGFIPPVKSYFVSYLLNLQNNRLASVNDHTINKFKYFRLIKLYRGFIPLDTLDPN